MSVASVLLSKAVSELSSPGLRPPAARLRRGEDGLDAVHDMMMDCLRKTSLAPMIDELNGAIIGGKMLRARLSLKIGSATGAPRDNLRRAAAAVEMVHAASLLHDDVIDGGYLRRGSPSFWTRKGISGAILLGDLLVCKAIQLLDGKEQGRLSGLLVRLAGEMCDAEVEQELVTGASAPRFGALGQAPSGETWMTERGARWEKSVAIARRKTGSLFAFAAAAAEGADGKRAAALLEAGYRIGTAYQLADDILDACGTPVGDGKDLGKDALKAKLTSASAAAGTVVLARQHVSKLCADSSQLLVAWPSVQEAWDEYVKNDLGPVVKLFTGGYQ